jgi:hypothetical protein
MLNLFHVAEPATPVAEQKYRRPPKYSTCPAVPAVPALVGAPEAHGDKNNEPMLLDVVAVVPSPTKALSSRVKTPAVTVPDWAVFNVAIRP